MSGDGVIAQLKAGHQQFIGDRQAYIEQLKQLDTSAIITRAERLVNNTFIFDKAWDMERCNANVHFDGDIDWHHIENGDPEWMFMINRHVFFDDLAQAYLVTADKRYVDALRRIWTSWLDSESDGEAMVLTTWRSLDVGIRLKTWIKVLDLLDIDADGLFDDTFISRVMASLSDQCRYQFKHHDPNQVQSN